MPAGKINAAHILAGVRERNSCKWTLLLIETAGSKTVACAYAASADIRSCSICWYALMQYLLICAHAAEIRSCFINSSYMQYRGAYANRNAHKHLLILRLYVAEGGGCFIASIAFTLTNAFYIEIPLASNRQRG